MNYILYTLIALFPSFVWLFWYLRKDKHPEPNSMVIRVFIWGMLIAFPAVIIENFAIGILDSLRMHETVRIALLYFVGVAVTEEVLKFFVVYRRVYKKTAEIDEPLDALVYMIISALGFAAIENIFLLIPIFQENFATGLNIAFSRFLGATFLHVLASSIIGYYLALSMRNPAQKARLLIHGFLLAVLLHGFYNILVIQLEKNIFFLIPVAILMIFVALLISTFIKKLSKMKSVTLS